MGLEFGVKVDNMGRDNGLCVCVVKPHGVSDKPLGKRSCTRKGEMDKENSKLDEEIKGFGRRIQNMENHLSPQLLENTEKSETLAPCTLSFPREINKKKINVGDLMLYTTTGAILVSTVLKKAEKGTRVLHICPLWKHVVPSSESQCPKKS